MEQREASGSSATGIDGDQDPRYANDQDDRYMRSYCMSRDDSYPHELDYSERELRDSDDVTPERWKRGKARVGEIGLLREEAKKRIVAEYERKLLDAKAKAEAEQINLINRLQRERWEAKEEEMRVFDSMERQNREEREAAQTSQHTPLDGPILLEAEREATAAELYQQSLERGIRNKAGIWPSRWNIPLRPTEAHRICQWSTFGHGGIVEQDEPMSEERLKQLIAGNSHTGDRVILINNIRHPHIGYLGYLLKLPVEAFYGLADFPRWHDHDKDKFRASKLIAIDDGIEQIFRKAKMLSSDDSRTRAMIRKLGNSMTATRDLLWFFDLHPEGAQSSRAIMGILSEVIPKILPSLPLLDKSAREPISQPDAMFLEALAAQLQGQLEECRLNWRFCVKGLSISSVTSEWNNHDAKILCIRAKKDICLIIVDEISRASETLRQDVYRPRDDIRNTPDTVKFPDPSVGKRVVVPLVADGNDSSMYLTLKAFLKQGWPIDILCGEELLVPRKPSLQPSTLPQPPSKFTALDPRAFLYLLASWSCSERLDKLDEASKQLSFHEIRNTKSAQQFYKLNEDLHSYRKELDTLKEHVTILSKNLPLYLEGYLDDFLVVKQRHAASLPEQLKAMLDRTKALDKFMINSFQILTSSVSVYESDQSSRQNELSILITVLAFIYVPLTLVTGIFGMNIVQAPNGFVWWSPLVALVVAVAFTVMMTIAALKGKKLWRRDKRHSEGQASDGNDGEARLDTSSIWERATGISSKNDLDELEQGRRTSRWVGMDETQS